MTADLTLILALGFAVYRCTRIATIDAISEPWRDWLYRKVQDVGSDKRSWARWGHTLLTCPYCISVYLSFLTVALYCWVVLGDWPGWDYVFASLAVAGVVALTMSVDLRLIRSD